jgi:hypothetical protein
LVTTRQWAAGRPGKLASLLAAEYVDDMPRRPDEGQALLQELKVLAEQIRVLTS